MAVDLATVKESAGICRKHAICPVHCDPSVSKGPLTHHAMGVGSRGSGMPAWGWPNGWNSPYKAATTAFPMSALANHPFVKMNGLGNEIVVVDMRGETGAVSAADARAAAQPQGVPFDQLMALYAPRTAGTDAYVRIYNSDGSEAGACGNGMRCVAELLSTQTGKQALRLQTSTAVLDCWKEDAALVYTVDMGKPRFAWNEIPLSEKFEDTRVIALQIGPLDKPVLHSPSVVNMGNPHAVFWVDDIDRYDLG